MKRHQAMVPRLMTERAMTQVKRAVLLQRQEKLEMMLHSTPETVIGTSEPTEADDSQ